MQLTWEERLDDGLSAIKVEPGDYDGVPNVRSLILGTNPERVNANIVAVAGALAFEAFISDEITMTSKLLPLVSEALAGFFAPRPMRTPEIDYKPQRILEGRGRLTVRRSGSPSNIAEPEIKNLGDFNVILTDNTESPRGYAHDGKIYLPTNARFISPRTPDDSRYLYTDIAATVLITGELGSRWIHLNHGGLESDDKQLIRARTLLRSVNRELSWS